MHLTKTDARHALATSFVPPAAGKCSVQVTFVGGRVASSPEVAVAMVVASARATCLGVDEIVEAAPSDCHIVRLVVAIEIAVDAVLEITMVDPSVLARLKCQVIVAVDVVGTSALEGHVAHDEVLATLDEHDARLCLFRTVLVHHRRAGKAVNSEILGVLDVYVTIDFNLSLHVDGHLAIGIFLCVVACRLQGTLQLGEGCDYNGIFVVAARYGSTNGSPAYRRRAIRWDSRNADGDGQHEHEAG